MRTSRFDTPAMFGDHHVSEVRRLLLGLPGVTEVYASSAFRIVEVTYDADKITETEVGSKLEEAGYLGELTVPVESNNAAHHSDGEIPDIRHTAIFETTQKVVSFGRPAAYSGKPLWPCPGLGKVGIAEEMER